MAEYVNTLISPDYGQDSGDAPVSSACLSNDDILAFVLGDWSEEQLGTIHGHVDQCETCQRLVNEAAHALDAEPISESTRPSWNTVFQPNTVVGQRYRILRLIARGGMGEVYEAYDTELQERLALKTVTSTACDSVRAVRSLKAEVHLTRRINHPNVCRIYDFRTHIVEASGAAIHFLAMEFVEGECLGKKLRAAGPLPLEQSLTIARELLLGLGAAHHAGILHRDFKSDNVMLRTENGGRLSPVILDFGLAKVLNASGHAATTVTQGRAMIGTIEYMAPEQVAGEALTVSSDLYAFGCVWFEMLTGRLPFACDSAAVSAVARLHRAPIAPSSVNPNVPKWLDRLVLRCLNRQPERRFESAEQVLDALAGAMASPPSRRKAARGRWLTVTTVALVLLSGVFLTEAVLRTGARVGTPSAQPLSAVTGSFLREVPLALPSVLSLPTKPRTVGADTKRIRPVGEPLAPSTGLPSVAQSTSAGDMARASNEPGPASTSSPEPELDLVPTRKKHNWESL